MIRLFVAYSKYFAGIDEPIQTSMESRKSYNQHYAAFLLNIQDGTDSIVDSGFIIQLATKLIVET